MSETVYHQQNGLRMGATIGDGVISLRCVGDCNGNDAYVDIKASDLQWKYKGEQWAWDHLERHFRIYCNQLCDPVKHEVKS